MGLAPENREGSGCKNCTQDSPAFSVPEVASTPFKVKASDFTDRACYSYFMQIRVIILEIKMYFTVATKTRVQLFLYFVNP